MLSKRLALPAIILCSATLAGCSALSADRETVYQVSTLHALLEGVYDGGTTLTQLRTRGDFGIGTFNALDGEMVLCDGTFYQVKADGIAYRPADTTKTPFACVTFFDQDMQMALPAGMEAPAFQKYLDARLPTLNLPCAIRITGAFAYMKTRSVPAQRKPYPRLVEVVKHQPTFEFHHVKGTVVGFRLPKYMDGINVPGYHLHFVNAAGNAGGHILAFTIADAIVEVDISPDIFLRLPHGKSFAAADLSLNKAGEVKRVEK